MSNETAPIITVNTAPAKDTPATYNPVAYQQAAMLAALESANKHVADQNFQQAIDIMYGIVHIAKQIPELRTFPLEQSERFIEYSKGSAIYVLPQMVAEIARSDPEMQGLYKAHTFPLLLDILEKDGTHGIDISKLIDSAHGDEEMISQIHDAVRPAICQSIEQQKPETLRSLFRALSCYSPHDLVIMTEEAAMEKSGQRERLFIVQQNAASPIRLVYNSPHGTSPDTSSKMPIDVLVGLHDGSITKDAAKKRVEEVTGKPTLVL